MTKPMKCFVNKNGELYLTSPMIKESAIRKRFISCLHEVLQFQTQESVAAQLGKAAPYIAKIRTAASTRLPAELIASFCDAFGYSPHYILLGQGEKRASAPISKEKERDLMQLKLIETLLNALVAGGRIDDATKKLARQVMKSHQ